MKVALAPARRNPSKMSGARRRNFGDVSESHIKQRIRELLFPSFEDEQEKDETMVCPEDGELPCNDDSPNAVVDTTFNLLCECLDKLPGERNVPLFIRIVCLCDEAVVKELLESTQMALLSPKTENPHQTHGGTFIKLLKRRIRPEIAKEIWREQQRQQSAFKRQKRNASALDREIDGLRKRYN